MVLFNGAMFGGGSDINYEWMTNPIIIKIWEFSLILWWIPFYLSYKVWIKHKPK